MNTHRFFFLPFLAVACVSAHVSETVSFDQEVFFPGVLLPSSVTQTVEQSEPLDVSEAVSKLKDLGSPSVSISENSLSGDISFVSHLKIALENGNDPTLTLVDMDIVPGETVQQFPVLVSGDQLFSHLASPAKIRFWITGKLPSAGTALHYHLSLSVSEQINKSL